MKNIFIDETAYIEFKELLDESNVESYNIRISLSHFTRRGPIFDVTVDEPDEDDEIEKVNDITFIVNKSVLGEFGGFIIVSSKENNGNGVGLKPVVSPDVDFNGDCSGECNSGCGGCSGCKEHDRK